MAAKKNISLDGNTNESGMFNAIMSVNHIRELFEAQC